MLSAEKMITFNAKKSFASAGIAAALLISCNAQPEKTATEDSSADVEPEAYVADHDIAMTVSSIADAISVGEQLAPSDYDYTGIFTDGRGTPIYTDIDGAPGEWTVKVQDQKTAIISNNNGGDLLPQSLIKYVISNTRIDAANRKEQDNADVIQYDDVLSEVYKFEGGEISFDTDMEEFDDGQEYYRMTITVRADDTF